MKFEGIGLQRKEEMFFNIIMPFIMVYSEHNGFQNFLKFMFENSYLLSEKQSYQIF